ncbi:MAG: ADP-ribosylglycohydrolase family protein [Actinomycetaceae bacterium]|nr:ADP-ribosylglycohydrolase family protein [Actinomycetaceae bacterium]
MSEQFPIPTPKSRGSAVRLDRSHADLALAAVGALTGFAAGSALGIPWELQRAPAVEEKLSMSGRDGFLAGEWGSDVQIALCIAEVASAGRLATASAIEAVAQRLIAWYESNPQHVPRLLQGVFDVALNPRLASPLVVEDLVAHGCGQLAASDVRVAIALRRAAEYRGNSERITRRMTESASLAIAVPVALATLTAPEECTRTVTLVTTLTTTDPLVISLNLVYAHTLRRVVEGYARGIHWGSALRISDLVDLVIEHGQSVIANLEIDGLNTPIVTDTGFNQEVIDALIVLRDESNRGVGQGWSRGLGAGLDGVSAMRRVIAACETAVWEFERNSSLNPVTVGIESAIRSGGDTDTVAALTGALLGGACGLAAIPEFWLTDLWGWPGLRADGLRDLATGCVYAGLAPEKHLPDTTDI